MTSLFDTLTVGELTLSNRIIMAPLTRMRSKQPGNIPQPMNTEYYAQRASAGLIITEATQISQQGQGYPATPGIHSADQVEGWKHITEAVHQRDGKIFLQLWHVGRISHSSHQPDGGLPVAPSAIKPTGKVFTAQWKQADYETPHALEIQEIKHILEDYHQASVNAKSAGFDGVEVHGANGYLLDQFLQDGSNKRQDEYGGSIENRARLLLETVDIAINTWGKGRVGVRLSPYGTFNDMSDSDPVSLFSYVIGQLNQRQVAYIHVIEPRATSAGGSDAIAADAPSASALFRKAFDGVFISAGGYTPESAKSAIAANQADAIAFGRLFIANPDLPERIRTSAPLNAYNRATFYGGGEKGYTDYPFLTQQAA
jgi:N-ethylmaleimide reductase